MPGYTGFDRSFRMTRDNPHLLDAEAEITWGELRKIVDTIAWILNRYSGAYDRNTYALEPINIDDVDTVLDILDEYVRRQRQRMKVDR